MNAGGKMIRQVRWFRLFCYCLMAIGLLLLWSICAHIDTTVSYVLFVVFSLAWVLFICYFIRSYMFGRILRVLTDECDPGKHIEILDTFINETASWKKTDITRFYLAKTTGLSLAGRLQEAAELLQGVKPRIKRPIDKAVFENNIFIVHCHAHQFDEAQEALSRMQDVILTLKKQYRMRYERLLLEKTILIKMEKGNYENAELVFAEMYRMAKSRYERVAAKFIIGRIYLHDGKLEEAKEAFTYVVRNGNRLFYVTTAESYLNEIRHKDIIL